MDHGRPRRRTLFDAQVERHHLVQKYLKKLNTVEGKLKLVGGSADHEGRPFEWSVKDDLKLNTLTQEKKCFSELNLSQFR